MQPLKYLYTLLFFLVILLGTAAEYAHYPVHVPPMLAGAGDQTLEEMTGALQFVSFGLDLATDPEIAKQTWEQISGLSPADVKKMIVDAAQSKADKYAEGGVIARHEAGKDVILPLLMFFTNNPEASRSLTGLEQLKNKE